MLKETGVRQFGGYWAIDTDGFGLKPQPRNHSTIAYGIDNLMQAIGKTFQGRNPLAYRGPPITRVVIPSAIDAKHIDIQISCLLDQGHQFFCGRIPVDGIHIIIKNNERSGCSPHLLPDNAPITCQCFDGGVEGIPQCDRHRNRCELFTTPQALRPCMVLPIGA